MVLAGRFQVNISAVHLGEILQPSAHFVGNGMSLIQVNVSSHFDMQVDYQAGSHIVGDDLVYGLNTQRLGGHLYDPLPQSARRSSSTEEAQVLTPDEKSGPENPDRHYESSHRVQDRGDI